MSNYKDRGIIKWAPFDGLAGFNDLYLNLKYQLLKKDKPILSEDKLNEMDIILKKAIKMQSDVSVWYYCDGYTKQLYGSITKLDVDCRMIAIENIKISLDQIVDLIIN